MTGGGPISSHHDIRVQVVHYHREGYMPSADGGEIREEMPLREFLERIFRDDPRSVENELYRVSKCTAGGHYYNNDEISRIMHKYDAMYSELIRKGKLVLAQHKISQQMMGIGGSIDPYNGRQAAMAQKSAMDYHQEHMLREIAYPHSPSRGIFDTGPSKRELIEIEEKKLKKKRDDDLFFLTT